MSIILLIVNAESSISSINSLSSSELSEIGFDVVDIETDDKEPILI